MSQQVNEQGSLWASVSPPCTMLELVHSLLSAQKLWYWGLGPAACTALHESCVSVPSKPETPQGAMISPILRPQHEAQTLTQTFCQYLFSE